MVDKAAALQMILSKAQKVPEGATVTSWKTVPHKAIWNDIGLKCLLPTEAMADAFWNVFSEKCKYLNGNGGYYESFGLAYEAMLDAWEDQPLKTPDGSEL